MIGKRFGFFQGWYYIVKAEMRNARAMRRAPEAYTMSNERIVALNGAHIGKVYSIGERLTIGRHPDNDLQLDDLQVSRMHARIELGARGVILRDMSSGNGTFVGDQRILEYKLSPGDVIRIGAMEFRFEAETPPAADEGSMVRFESGSDQNLEGTSAAEMHHTLFQAPLKVATEDQLRETQRRLQAIYTANQIITSEHNLSRLFARVMDQIFAMVPAHNGVIMLQDPKRQELVTEFVKSGLPDSTMTISSSIVNRAFVKGEAVITKDAADDSRFEGGSIIRQNIASAMCVPLTHQDECLGVLYVDTRGTTNAFVQSDLEMLVALAGPAAIAIRNAQYLHMVEQGYQDTLTVLANAIELRDHYTVGHTWRVTNFSMEIARELGWPPEKLDEVQMGGVLHDVGKIAVDDAILRKPDRLTEEEYAKMKVHPERGAQLLQDVTFLHPLIPYCLYHHERYDGNGYPFGLKGEDIPIEGRIVAVADTFDAMTSNRPYRKGLDPEIAINELIKGRETQFDPVCVDALLACYRAGKIDRILQENFKSGVNSIACPFCSTFIRLPENVDEGHAFLCNVCHRNIRIMFQNGVYFGELIRQSGLVDSNMSSNHDINDANQH
jgi:HD-GYP domain-containing protein (c-di-GMP phosphodiesterase class II)